ncbi:hypothetical protein SAMN06265379_11720 [Saccharicrinis carchari]|uniref:Uncharacterized protein n=1 Tax=Saccharicrinis carchari TaxID=1168039 RepID=A0A521FBC4_SACCC|nr:hypothetical protein [Saccharicrinis carchari]SMO92941.1 hypothetical protein SAMN06265379_11720 [Saccharicrinis carchari]
MTRILQVLTLLLFSVSIISCHQTSIEKLKSELDENTLFVLNDKFVILNAQDFLNQIKNPSILKFEISDSLAVEYKSPYSAVVHVLTDSTSQIAFNKSKWLEYRFVKKVNPNIKMFYMLDGMPIHDYSSVKNYLTNRIITKLNFIPPNQAVAIWGNREGKNGATQIWTETNEDELIIPVIVKKTHGNNK